VWRVEFDRFLDELDMRRKKKRDSTVQVNLTTYAKIFPDGTRFEVSTDWLHEGDKQAVHEFLQTTALATPLIETESCAPSAAQSGPLVSTAIAEYLTTETARRDLDPKTVAEYRHALQVFTEILGDFPIRSIRVQDVAKYRETLRKLPVHMSKRYPGQSVAEILKRTHPKTLNLATVNQQIGRVSQLFDWAIQNELATINPAKRQGIRRKKAPRTERHEFSRPQLDTIFQALATLPLRHSYQVWAPLLALYTGARLNEIAQLELDDIREHEGIAYISITDEGSGEKKVKTSAGRRDVPLHPHLKELGFLDYVDQLRERNQLRLFTKLKKSRDGFGRKLSRWFNEDFLVSINIKELGDRKLVFHSFRHTFANALKQKDVEESMIGELMGHANDSVTTGRYVKDPRLETKREAIGKLAFELPIEALRAQWAKIKN